MNTHSYQHSDQRGDQLATLDPSLQRTQATR